MATYAEASMYMAWKKSGAYSKSPSVFPLAILKLLDSELEKKVARTTETRAMTNAMICRGSYKLDCRGLISIFGSRAPNTQLVDID